MSAIKWMEYEDCRRGTPSSVFYEGASPYHDEGSPFMWRIESVALNDECLWELTSDGELQDPDETDIVYHSIEDAQAECQRMHDEILAEERASTAQD